MFGVHVVPGTSAELVWAAIASMLVKSVKVVVKVGRAPP